MLIIGGIGRRLQQRQQVQQGAHTSPAYLELVEMRHSCCPGCRGEMTKQKLQSVPTCMTGSEGSVAGHAGHSRAAAAASRPHKSGAE